MFDINAIVKTHFQKTKPVWIILLGTGILLLIEVFFYFIFILFKIPHESNLPFKIPASHFEVVLYMFSRFIKACLLAPIIETFIFQYLMHEILCVKFKFNTKTFIFLSAIIFGLSHYTYYSTVLVTLVICVVFNYFYVVLIETNRKKKAYLTIALIHSSLNACVFIDQCF
jgi:hypothetical protein